MASNNNLISYDNLYLALTRMKEHIDSQLSTKSPVGHTHSYAGSSSAGGAANSVKSNLAIKLNGGTTEGTDLFTFNGSAAKTVNVTPSAIGAAESSHNHGLLHSSFAVNVDNTTTDSGWTMLNSTYNGFLLKSIRTAASAPNWICNNYAAGIAFGGADTKGVLSCAYNSPQIKIAGGNGTKPSWWIGITGTTGTTYDLSSFAASGHTHNYAGSSSAGGAANSVKTSLIIKLNGGTAEGTNLFTFNGSTAKTVNVTPSAIGAAASSHTHNYAGSSSAGGAATSANKVNSNLAIKLNSGSTEGTNLFTFNGSAAKTVNITPSAIGAAASSHTHTYAGSSSAGGAATSANKVNTNLTIKLNGGSTEGTNLFTFNGSTAKTVNITPSAIGAAASSHGTHLSLGTTSSTAYRGDYGNTAYTHSQAAHAPSTAQKNSDITKAEIEAKLTGAITSHTHSYASTSHTHSGYAASSHTHSYASTSHTHSGYLSTSGGTLTGTLTSRNIKPSSDNTYSIGTESYKYYYMYVNGASFTSDRECKENIVYIKDNTETSSSEDLNITYDNLYKFVRDDLELATYNLKYASDNDDYRTNINFIAQDLLYNTDESDNVIGQMIVPPIPAPTDEEAESFGELDENGIVINSPTLSFDLGNYVSVLAGALKEAINKIESLEEVVNQQQELINQLLNN